MMTHSKHPSLLLALALAALTVETAPASTLIAWGRSWNGQGEVPGWVQNPVAMAAGQNHNLVIQADGTVAGWGDNSYGQASAPPEAQGRTVAVAAGQSFSIALLLDGSILSWGALNAPPAGASNIVAVAAGFAHGLALRQDGRVLAWGDNASGQAESGGITDAVAVAGMAQSSLALRRDGTVAAWGNNVLGQTDVPPGLSNVVAVAGGSSHALALRNDGTVVAWGHNASGQTAVPAGLSGVAAIAAGGYYSLALRSNGTVVAWGGGGEGVTNLPSGLTNILALAGGEGHALALRGPMAPFFTRPRLPHVATVGSSLTLEAPARGSGPLDYHWYFQGTNRPNGNQPSLRLADLHFADAGTYVVIASNSLGSVLGFLPLSVVSLQLREQPASQAAFPGDHVTFRVGIESGTPLSYQWRHAGTNLPGATNATLTLLNVSASQAGSYTVLASNSTDWVLSAKAVLSFPPLAAWGGDAWAPITPWPAGLSNVVTVAAGWGHAVALAPDGSLRAWGQNDTGQTNVPAGLGPVVAVAAGGAFTLALRADGSVAGWGSNEEGQLNIPAGLAGVAAIACGSSHAVALRTNGTVVAWGENQDGQADVPLGLDNVVAVAAGERHTLALRADGRVVGWGAGTDGQLDVPGDLTNAVAIASGGNHALALRADGTVSGWGTYFNGADFVPMEPPAGLSNVLSIAAGHDHGLVRLPRAVVGFGDHTFAQTNVPAHAAVSGGIAAGGHYGFALPAAGAPFLTSRLTDRSQRPGGTVHFRVEGNGARRMNFQWRRNGIPLPGQTNGVLTLTQLTPADAGAYSVTASNALGSVTLPPARLTVAPPPLEAALGTNAFPDLTLGGDAAWFAQSAVTHDGASAAQSGPITHLQETWMQTTVTGPGLLRFWWKVSSESDYDFLEFHLDGPSPGPTRALSGETDWMQETVALSAGEHTVGWRYVKDVFDDAGLDAGWVDDVTLSPLNETDAELRLLSLTRERVVTWSSTRTNIYVGFQYVERLGECFQDVPDDSFWNILQTNHTQSATLPAEAPPQLFLRLIGSAAPLTRSTFDVDTLGLPRFVTHDWVDLAKIGVLSRFRSAAGGDYSDDFESCRSMQHQFEPLAGVNPGEIAVFAPVTGRVCALTPNEAGGATVVIESQQRPAFAFHLGNIAPTNSLACGQWVMAGTPLGTFAGGGWTSSLSVWVRTPTGRKLVSCFDVMADSVFQSYQWRGVAAREALIISREARDSDPLTCAGFEFEGPGNLPNYLNLQ